MRFAGVNLGPDFLQSDQKRLNRVDAEGRAPSRALRPANFVFTLPMIACINWEMNPDRDFGLMTFGINPERSIKDYHVLPSSEAKGRNGTSCKAIPVPKSRLLPASPAPGLSTGSTVFLVERFALVLCGLTTLARLALQ